MLKVALLFLSCRKTVVSGLLVVVGFGDVVVAFSITKFLKTKKIQTQKTVVVVVAKTIVTPKKVFCY